MEKVDPSFERLYKSFKVRKPGQYPLPPLPPDELIEAVFKYSSIFYKALFAVLYEGSLGLGEALSIRLRHVEDREEYIKIIVLCRESLQRAVCIIKYQGYPREWLVEHPWRDLLDAFLFLARIKGS